MISAAPILRLLHGSLMGKVNIYKTIYYNLKLFPLPTALKFPVFVYGNSIIRSKRGTILLPEVLTTGQIKIGICLTHLADRKSETRINNCGIISFAGSCVIGNGSKILESETGRLSIGDSFNVTARLNIICEKSITINDDCMFSWDVTLIDTDYHPIKTDDGHIVNCPKPIIIGKHVWIGFNSQVLKGVEIPDNSIISSCCSVKRTQHKPNSIYSYPSNLLTNIRENIEWTKDVF